MATSFEYKGLKITWLNHHASFLVETRDGKKIYIDPWKIESQGDADLLLISHSHYDHFSQDDIRKIKTPHTTVVAAQDCDISGNVKKAVPGEKFNVDGMVIETVHAYNNKDERQNFHPRENRWIGFVINVDGVRIYHAGDTDVIEEMKKIKDIDIAFLPCGGTYTMDGSEAGEAANILQPKIAVPMHWGKIVGSRSDAETFAQNFEGETKILE